LTYDCRISSPALTAYNVTQIDLIVKKLVETLIGNITLSHAQLLQIQLPCNHGGAGLTPIHSIAHFAPIASYVQTTLPVRQWLWNFGIPWDAITSNIDTGACTISLNYLHHHNIHLDCNAQPKLHLTEHAFSPMPPPNFATNKMQGKYPNALAEQQLSKLIELYTDNHCETRLRSCGGTGGGDFLMVLPNNPDLTFSNLEFQTAVRRRLGLPTHARGIVCSRQTQNKGPAPRLGSPLETTQSSAEQEASTRNDITGCAICLHTRAWQRTFTPSLNNTSQNCSSGITNHNQ
jgi:hypothetical protein